MRPLLLPLSIALFAAGCAHGPAVESDALPLKRVVVYRNGVAYFERAGTVDRDRVEFKVRPEHIGDFLATLSVVEAGGSSVRSASFPIAPEAPGAEDPVRGSGPRALAGGAAARPHRVKPGDFSPRRPASATDAGRPAAPPPRARATETRAADFRPSPSHRPCPPG